MKNAGTPLISFGHSMHPLLKKHDLVFPEPVKKQSLKVDDIVVIEKQSFFITHRLIYLNKQSGKIITKGDNNPRPDKPIKNTRIIGKVSIIKRNNKSLNIEHIYLLQSLAYLKEILQINSFFSKQKIPFLFLKGLPVYLHYTKKPPRRIYADCDILIKPTNLAEVDKIFFSLGYKKQEISHHFLLDLFLGKKSEVSYWKIINNFKVTFDIHLEPTFFFVQSNNLFPLYPYNLVQKFSNLLLSQKKSVKVSDGIYPLLTSENQIIYLALHLFHDNFRGYHKYLLLEKVINSSKFNEQTTIQLIKEYRLENFLYPSFAFLKKYYYPNLSKNFLKQISPHPSKLNFVKNLIKSTNIFEDERHTLAGIRRFKNIYYLSNTNPLVKPFVFLKPSILALILFALIKRLRSISAAIQFKLYFYLHKNKSGSQAPKTTPQQQAIANQNQPSRL